MRRCSWTDYAIESEVGDFIIEGDSEILLHGSIANFDEHIGKLISVLESNAIGYTLEHYDEAGDLLTQVSSAPDQAGP